MFTFELSTISRRPEALPDVRPEITAHDVDFSDVGVSFGQGLWQRRRERRDVGNAVAGGHELAVIAPRHLVPPDVAIERAVHRQRHLRAARLLERIAIP